MALNEMIPGQCGVVTNIMVEPRLRARLFDFGMVSGTAVRCCYCSPDKSVTAIALRGTVLALRTKDLKQIWVRC